MAFDIQRIQKSTRRVRKFLRKNSKRPSSNAIHNLRTSTRSLETTFTTLTPNPKGTAKRLLFGLADVRKRAGKVRDMDVLTAHILTVNQTGEQDCLVQLLEHLGAKRNKSTKKLRHVIATASPQLRRNLKRNAKRVEKLLKEAESNRPDSDAMRVITAKAKTLSSELNSPGRLNRRNLHPYRLKVKELRDVLQLSNRPGDEEFLEKLGEVKDSIGEWHDWEELIAIASQLLDHGTSCELIKRLKDTSNSKYGRALSLTNNLRSNYLPSRTQEQGTAQTTIPTEPDPGLAESRAIA
jgi:CHAD domain-containing protein